uniref:Uncharacterized protein n=1 Tax=viral metagenome TaxID=1070528 RepID=A0A6C0I3K0_9ZZZZ
MSSRYNNGNNGKSGNQAKFCAVCHAAGRPGYDTHYVRADKFDRSSAITCPYLLSIECRICGETGHTSSYCKASNSSSTAPVAVAPVASLARVRLPPISSSSSSSSHSSKQIPRIVFPTLEKEQKQQFAAAFPELSNRKRQSTQSTLSSLPPLSFISRFRNDEPLLRRGPPEASPVHSPAAPSNKIVYNKRGNAFADLASSDEEEVGSPVYSPDAVGRYRATKPASWASLVTAPVVVVAAVAPVSKFPPRVVAAASLAPLPPLAFKPRKAPGTESAVPKQDKKKMWGDTDSEDDEEFLKRGGLE